jgi:hypothetical protein
MIGSILLFAAFACFVLAASGLVNAGKLNLTALGLAFWVLPQVLARLI